MKDGNDRFLPGIVSTRECPTCGHREVGYTTQDGVFHPLRPGTVIGLLQDNGTHREVFRQEDAGPGAMIRGGGGDDRVYDPWVPDPVLGDRKMRLKYGVMVRRDHPEERISPRLYRLAYLEKLRYLIEKEVFIPIPVILDRFFTAPQLASGDSKQIADAMWHELSEIREPALSVEKWLEQGDPKVFHGGATEAGVRTLPLEEVPGPEDLMRELDSLSLEEFLALL